VYYLSLAQFRSLCN